MKASDITVAGVEVTSITPSADWKTATVALKGTLPANKDVKASVKVGTETKDFTVNYKFGPQAVAVVAGSYDDDTANQKLTVTVDGKPTSVDYLKSAGYKVEFNAIDVKTGNNANLALFGASTNDNGILKDTGAIAEGDYKVTVTISNGKNIKTSDPSIITIRNLDNAATGINGDVEFINTTNAVYQNSTTLVVGEKAQFGLIQLDVNGSKAEINGTDSVVKLATSDKSIVSVDEASKTLKAEGIGTATITITIGKATKQVTVKVTGEKRVASSITNKNQSFLVKPTTGIGASGKVTVLDQYGDSIVGAPVTVEIPTNIKGITAGYKQTGTTDAYGQVSVNLSTDTTAVSGQSGTVNVKDNKDNIIGNFTLTTTADDAIASSKLVINPATSKSSDDEIDARLSISDDQVAYAVGNYNSEGLKLGNMTAAQLAGYTVKFDNKVVKVNGYNTTDTYTFPAAATDGSDITVTIVGNGTSAIKLYDEKGNLVDTRTVTVTNPGTLLSSATFKTVNTITGTATINYETILDVTKASGKDAIVKGLSFSSAPASQVRITTNGGKTIFYIDKDDNGTFTTGDLKVGELRYTISSDATGSLVPTTTPLDTAITGVTTTAGTAAKGTVTFQVVDTLSSPEKIVGTKAVDVNVVGKTSAADAAADAALVVAKTAVDTIDATTPTQAQIDAAQAKVDLVAAGDAKDALQAKIDAAQVKVNAAAGNTSKLTATETASFTGTAFADLTSKLANATITQKGTDLTVSGTGAVSTSAAFPALTSGAAYVGFNIEAPKDFTAVSYALDNGNSSSVDGDNNAYVVLSFTAAELAKTTGKTKSLTITWTNSTGSTVAKTFNIDYTDLVEAE